MFDIEPVALLALARGKPEPSGGGRALSTGQRLTLRQKGQIANGWHPFGMALHLDAPRDATPTDRGRDLTCGTCTFRVTVRHSAGAYPKCEKHGFAASAASDCRAWWPACTLYEPEKP